MKFKGNVSDIKRHVKCRRITNNAPSSLKAFHSISIGVVAWGLPPENERLHFQ